LKTKQRIKTLEEILQTTTLIETLADSHGDYAGIPGYNIHIDLVEADGEHGLVLAHDAGHPETGNPVLIKGDIDPLVAQTRAGEWPFVPGAYVPEDFPGCTLMELEHT